MHDITLVFLHFLGGSGRTWQPVISHLPAARTLTLDLPGFGDAAGAPGDTVTDMADAVGSRIAGLEAFALVGHSMGAKVAAVLARRAADGEPALAGLRRMVLMAGSPPAPEPMDEATRQKMLAFFRDDPATDREQAEGFVADNVGETLPPPLHALAVDDVLRADPHRWRAWLTGGSNEDWSARVAVLPFPALILAGADDPCLGPDAQRRLMAPHFADARLVDLPDAKHLLPLERPERVAALIAEHIQ